MKSDRGKRKSLLQLFKKYDNDNTYNILDIKVPIMEVNKMIFIIATVCRFSRHVWCKRYSKSHRTHTGVKIINSLNNHKRINKIARITTDRGKIFMSKEWRDLLKQRNITHIKTTVYHLESDGLVERTFLSGNQRMRCIGVLHGRRWYENFKNLRTVTNEVTNKATDFSPNDILSGKVQKPTYRKILISITKERAKIQTLKEKNLYHQKEAKD
jgi:Integrase core domain